MGASAYTRERLEEAARGARTLSEALGRLGVDPRSSTRRYVFERMKKLGVDVSHFEGDGVKWTRDVLERAVAASTNMCEVLRHLGLEVVGGHHTHISRRVKAYGIDTSHFQVPTRRGKPWRPRTPEALLVQQPDDRARRVPSDRLKWAMTALGVADQCALCGTEAVWRGRPLPLEVDHIDGSWRDNRIENLRFLCPNCHSTTDNYRGRGKGRSRGRVS
ncbi:MULTISPECIES: HNH endonuclease signature motif containing protein [Streptomyces]|uniref:HNH endonuclease signature motif containing protein n=1 Tax=Streptomyces TaxID=1883 RepID=UPI00287FCEBB|nr:HNH endonuclease signature motif containing protein [Streptomyces sp. CGMCC 4.1456]WNF62728.1 HNH endonuclease signature motif containing protein [Streptomyces sp. CGMCC 4.1456]